MSKCTLKTTECEKSSFARNLGRISRRVMRHSWKCSKYSCNPYADCRSRCHLHYTRLQVVSFSSQSHYVQDSKLYFRNAIGKRSVPPHPELKILLPECCNPVCPCSIPRRITALDSRDSQTNVSHPSRPRSAPYSLPPRCRLHTTEPLIFLVIKERLIGIDLAACSDHLQL